MDPSEYVTALRHRWVVIVLAVLAALAGAGALSVRATPQYSASAALYFSYAPTDGSASELNQGSAFVRDQVRSFVGLATEDVVLRPVIQDLRLSTTETALAGTLTVHYEADSALLRITAHSPSADRAAAVANAVTAQVARTVNDLAPTGKGSARSIAVTNVATAAVPTTPASRSLLTSLIGGGLAGLLLGVTGAVLLYAADSRVRHARDVRRVTPLPLLGRFGRERRPQVREDATGPHAERVRQLRTALLSFGVTAQRRTLVVTSPSAGEGKTTVAVDLAVAMAEAGYRVVLVDAHLRAPGVADRLGLSGQVGLAEVLSGTSTTAQAVQVWGRHGLRVLPAGAPPAGPSELLGSPRMDALLAELTADADLVVLDTAPLLPVTDAMLMALRADGTCLVVDSTRTRRAPLGRAVEALALTGAPVLGVVLNRTRTERGAPAPAHAAPATPAAAPPGVVQAGQRQPGRSVTPARG